jgi:RND family efflux transporter MFP subunit
MNLTFKIAIMAGLLSGMVSPGYSAGSNEAKDKHSPSATEEHKGEVPLSSVQQKLANIKVETLQPRTIDYQIYAPGEIKANGYTSYLVSPRVKSVVLRRHAALGEHVEQGQPLVTLFSSIVAEAQASYIVARAEWQRVKKLGIGAIGAKRFNSASTNFNADYGRLIAFGLSEKSIQALSTESKSLGEYTLSAATSGVVLTDDFHQGQSVEPGSALMELANEKQLWVEARLPPNSSLQLPAGTPAQIKVDNGLFSAQVTQEAHTIDPLTRTRVVRLLVNNSSHLLHPGMFSDVYFSFATKRPILAVPENALMRSSDGDWTVFVEDEPGRFKSKEVALGRSLGEWREIKGIEAGTKIVTEGAFFVASEIAKGGFDPHGH